MKIKCNKISERKINLIVNCFITDIPSVSCAKIVGVNRKTSDYYYNLFRQLIIEDEKASRLEYLDYKEDIKGVKNGQGYEADESYFGPSRVRGKRGRGAGKKIIVLGLLKRKGRVFVKILTKAEKAQILPVILEKIMPGSDIYTDGWASYDALALHGFNHYTVNHGENEFAREGTYHVNGIESFWSYGKRRLAKFNGVKKTHFENYLLETEWRHNHSLTMKKDLKKLVKKAYSN